MPSKINRQEQSKRRQRTSALASPAVGAVVGTLFLVCMLLWYCFNMLRDGDISFPRPLFRPHTLHTDTAAASQLAYTPQYFMPSDLHETRSIKSIFAENRSSDVPLPIKSRESTEGRRQQRRGVAAVVPGTLSICLVRFLARQRTAT